VAKPKTRYSTLFVTCAVNTILEYARILARHWPYSVDTATSISLPGADGVTRARWAPLAQPYMWRPEDACQSALPGNNLINRSKGTMLNA
jgi:hypothetical protein